MMTHRTVWAAYRRSFLLTILTCIFTFSCSNDNSGDSNSDIDFRNAVLLDFTSDYTTGELRFLNTNSTELSDKGMSFPQDSKVFTHNENIFVLSGTTSNFTCLKQDVIIDQNALEAGSNPYEVAVVNNTGFIALLEVPYLQTFDVETCAISKKIELSHLSSTSTIKASGDTLLITAQRLENYLATKPGLLVRVKADGTLIDTIQLKIYNPGATVLDNGKLYVSSTAYNADFSVNLEKSGIEIVDLATGTSEVLFNGVELGGGAVGITLDKSTQTLYASVYAEYGTAPVKPIDLNSKTIGTALPNITDSFGGVVFDNESKKLFVGDRAYGASGLKIYDTATKTTITATDKNNSILPPASLAILN